MPHKLTAACLFGLLLGACAEHRAAGPPPSQSTARAPTVASPVQSGSGAAPRGAAAAAPWVEALRFEQWAEAATMLDALPAQERARPEMKYARARVALALKDHARAAELLHGLDAELPLLGRQIARFRAESALEVGPFEEAGAYFAASSGADDLARAADAYRKAGDVAKARVLATRAVVTAQQAQQARSVKTRAEAVARMARARIQLAGAPAAAGAPAPATAQLAAPDLRWIVKNAPSSPEAREAAKALAALAPPSSASAPPDTAAAMPASGSAAEAVAELGKLSSVGAASADALHRKATSLYEARAYAAAADAFIKAAAVPSSRQAEQLHFAARALARANRDADAIQRHLAVATRFRRTRWGERSSFLAARLLLQLGRYRDAVAQYSRYIDTYPRGARRDDAQYERALATLSSGDAPTARRRFEQLALKAPAVEAARLRELAGLAASRAGDRDAAVQLWTDVMVDQPLSWAALLARSRLASIGAPSPPLLVPGSQRVAAPLSVRLPPQVALLSSIGLDGDAETYLAENEHEAAASYPGREGEALCMMYGMLSHAKRRYRVGTQAVASAALQRAPGQDERWTWECLYPAPYLGAVRALEAEQGLPKGLVHALMRQESGFDPVAVSPASAVGLMQLMPATAQHAAKELALGFEVGQLTSPPMNLRLGGFYLGKLLRTFQGNLPLATAAYNAGPKAVSHWVETGDDRDTDVWVARIPYDETRGYVARVLSNLARYQWLDGGDAAVEMTPLQIPADARAPDDAY